jgi:hypothetical protein
MLLKLNGLFKILNSSLILLFFSKNIKISTSVTTNDDQSFTDSSDFNSQESPKSIGRDFAPIFFILAILFALILLGFITTLYNHRLYQKNNNTSQTGRRNNNSVYSQLTSENEFDLN